MNPPLHPHDLDTPEPSPMPATAASPPPIRIPDATTPAIPGRDATTRTPPAWQLLWVELRDELLGIVREPTALFFSIAMPVGFFALLTSLWGGETSGSTLAGTTMLATFGTFGVLGVTLFNPGVGVADDRERGWLRAKRVSATPLPVTLAAKCLATLPYAIGVLAAMTAASALTGTLDLDVMAWFRLVGVLALGALPFGLLGLAVGLIATPNATTAILQAVLIPSVIASGLMFPLDMLPEIVQRVAPALPPYHLAQLGLAQIEGGPVLVHVAVIVGSTAVAAGLAALAYRRGRP